MRAETQRETIDEAQTKRHAQITHMQRGAERHTERRTQRSHMQTKKDAATPTMRAKRERPPTHRRHI